MGLQHGILGFLNYGPCSVYAAVRGADAGGGRYRVLHTIEKKQ